MEYENEVDEEEVVEGEELVGDPLALTHRCTACYEEFTVLELHNNLNDCPTCKETDVIMEK